MKLKSLLQLLLIPLLVSFSIQGKANNTQNGVGVGLQYGGVFGWQAAIIEEKTRLRIGAGLLGLSVGVDYLVLPKVSIGASAFGTPVLGGVAAVGNINFYSNSFQAKSWVIGLDAGFIKSDKLFNQGSDVGGLVLLSIGYSY